MSLQLNNALNISDNFNLINVCPPIETFSQKNVFTNYHIKVNESLEYVFINECDDKNGFISEYMMKCDSNRGWIRQRTVYKVNRNDNLCREEDSLNKHYLCFDREVLQSCKGGYHLSQFEISAIILGLISLISICIISFMICVVIKYKNKKILSTNRNENYENNPNDEYIDTTSDYHSIDSTYFDANYENVDEFTENDQNVIETNSHVLNIEENLVRNPSYETLR
jgi:hypothetical protein